MTRPDGRQPNDLRPISFETGYIAHHPGSVLVSFGQTRVLCVCTVEERVPPFRLASGGGWMTASYAMLPASTHERRRREGAGHAPDGRSVEIQRLIGRALRNCLDLDALGQRTLNVDCDVIQADGGTRTAAITGGWVAVRLALEALARGGRSPSTKVDNVLIGQIGAVSMGLTNGSVLTDLCYKEDVGVDTDLNLVAYTDGRIVEVQGTAEGIPMQRKELDQMIDQGLSAIAELGRAQLAAVEKALA